MKVASAGFAAALILWPGASMAHGIGNLAGYQQVLHSMLDSVNAPGIVLLVIGFGLMAGTSGLDQARPALGLLAVGLLLGMVAAASFGPFGATACLVIGALCSLLSAASLPALSKVMVPLSGLAAGLAASIYNLDGHPLPSLPIPVLLGVILGPLGMAAVLTGWIGMALQRCEQGWLRIMFRILSSWSFAANAIYLAVQLKAGG